MKTLYKRLLNTLVLWLMRLAYEPLTLRLNKRPIEAIPGMMIDGRQLYRFKNELDLPIKRKVALQAFDQWFDLKVTNQTLTDLCKTGMKANNAMDHSKVGAIFYSIQDMINNCTPREALYQIGSVLYFFEDENLETYDSDLGAFKVEHFKRMNEDFFLRRVLESRGVSSESSQNSILTSLSLQDKKLKLYQSLATAG